MHGEVVIVGAGVAGLSCARELVAGGARVVVIDRGRGVGGRCATRRVDGQPVDHGVSFLHGSHPDFVRAMGEIEATKLEGWPRVREGNGRPCQTDAFRPGEARVAYEEGLSAFPKHLAQGLELRLGTNVVGLEHKRGSVMLSTESGDRIEARSLVLALATEQLTSLAAPLFPLNDAFDAAGRLLSQLASVPSLTVIAGYSRALPRPAFHVAYPESSRIIMLASHDSSKRPEAQWLVMVYQCHTGFSRKHLSEPREQWSGLVLEEASRVLGPWAGKPEWGQAHLWEYARVDRGNELSAPILVEIEGGARVGMAGEVFAPGGGIQAAWLSGRNLARRMLGKEAAS